MKTLLTLDYELFLGAHTGSIEKCLFEPMDRLTAVAERYGVRFTIFIDATYLVAVQRVNKDEFEAVCRHIRSLHEAGHDIELHIHPQWAYSTYKNGEWELDREHFRLSQLSFEDAARIFGEARECLEGVTGKKSVGFRAGGFSAQPTEMLTKLLSANGIIADSSVISGSSYDSDYQQYDYTKAPDKSRYRFDEDICVEEQTGRFVEIPISTTPVLPLTHRKIAAKYINSSFYRRFSDGEGVAMKGESILKLLTGRMRGLCTIDGLRVCFLRRAFRQHLKRGRELFCVLGHPKLATPHSVAKFEQFLKRAIGRTEFTTLDRLI